MALRRGSSQIFGDGDAELAHQGTGSSIQELNVTTDRQVDRATDSDEIRGSWYGGGRGGALGTAGTERIVWNTLLSSPAMA